MPHQKLSPRPVRQARPAPKTGLVITVVVAVAVMILLFGLGAAVENIGHAEPAAGSEGAGPAPAAPEAPGIGWAVRDGRFEFVVSGMDCSRSTLGVERLKRTAKGRYCVATLTVRNIGESPQLFLGRAQKVIDDDGAEYTNDELAGLYANGDIQTFVRKIDPGRKVTGKVVFDVPKAATLTTMELHDSPLSGGVRITLR